MVERGAGGCIVNISSIGGKTGGADTAAYAASKAGVQSLTSSMAKELGRSGIRVNALCRASPPPAVSTTGPQTSGSGTSKPTFRCSARAILAK